MQYNYLYGIPTPYIYNENNEIVFSVNSKIVPANDQSQGGVVNVTFQTNNNVIEKDKYIL